MSLIVEITQDKNRLCHINKKPCLFNNTDTCLNCGVYTGNINKPILYKKESGVLLK